MYSLINCVTRKALCALLIKVVFASSSQEKPRPGHLLGGQDRTDGLLSRSGGCSRVVVVSEQWVVKESSITGTGGGGGCEGGGGLCSRIFPHGLLMPLV